MCPITIYDDSTLIARNNQSTPRRRNSTPFERSPMTDFTQHPAFAWLGKDALTLPVYAESFNGAAITTKGESPYLDAKKAGIELALNADHMVRAVDLYAQGIEGFDAYADPLPAGRALSNNRADVVAAMGAPALSMDAGGVGLMAIEFAFDRFEASNHYVRFEYGEGETAVRMVTIGYCDA